MYAKYRVVAYDEKDREIEAQVFDGTPEQVMSEMFAYLTTKGIIPKKLELDTVNHEAGNIR